MNRNKSFFLALVALLILVGIQTAHAQPPPPPPPSDGPPCWPPPCVPADNGMIYAVIAAVAFGVLAFLRLKKVRVASK